MRERRRRVLVVEDDRALADMYCTALRFSGFDVDGATDGVSALRLIDQSVPDVVVLDLHLPRLRGQAILQEITNRADLCDIPVIIVTGADPSPAVAQAADSPQAVPAGPAALHHRQSFRGRPARP